jgi:hypothetical protein
MMNLKLIEDAVSMVVEYFEYEHICENSDSIRKRVIDWYNNTDIADARTLAATAMSGSYVKGITWNEIMKIEDFFYPENPYDNFYIGDIEASYYDCFC